MLHLVYPRGERYRARFFLLSTMMTIAGFFVIKNGAFNVYFSVDFDRVLGVPGGTC